MRHTDRTLFDVTERAPPPGRYNISGSMIKPSLNTLFNPNA
jgi:hypothetical protein